MPGQKKKSYASVEPRLINASDVARMLSISKTTLWRLPASGRLPRPLRIGGSVRWRITDIRAWIEDGRSDLRSLTRRTSWPKREVTAS